ncbi:MAG TPA: Fic family protein [Candidatus Saccharimonadales bacterium]|nr:Fic family protein [Candidatus Saccharimonadales bacterium]
MIFKPPALLSAELDVIEQINAMRHSLRHAIGASRRWAGTLRRTTLARNIRHSNSIEGINVTRDDALAAVDHDEPLTAESSAWQSTLGYRNAMTYALQLADDPHFSYSEGLIRSLHFMMLQHELARHPGRYRSGLIFVHDDKKQQTVYEGPPPEDVPRLMAALVDSLNAPSTIPAIVRAAMGHLNLVMIHPFADGNGRMARCLQTLVLGREQISEPPFCSIEEYLGRFTHEYYAVLTEVGQGAFHPQNDCRAWVRFNLVAHFRQASWLLQRSRMTQRVWNDVEQLAGRKGLNERGLSTLVDAAFGFKIRRTHYMHSAEVSEQVASRDLRIMVDHGLLVGEGETRGRIYHASPLLEEIYSRHYETRTSVDPFISERSTLVAANAV